MDLRKPKSTCNVAFDILFIVLRLFLVSYASSLQVTITFAENPSYLAKVKKLLTFIMIIFAGGQVIHVQRQAHIKRVLKRSYMFEDITSCNQCGTSESRIFFKRSTFLDLKLKDSESGYCM